MGTAGVARITARVANCRGGSRAPFKGFVSFDSIIPEGGQCFQAVSSEILTCVAKQGFFFLSFDCHFSCS